MNAVRLRKEAQVYSAEEMRALAIKNMEERARKDSNLMAYYRGILNEKLKEKGAQ